MARRLLYALVLLAVLLTALLSVLLTFGPGMAERSLNRIHPHEPWPIGRRAQTLHDSIHVADLHADPLLWKRDWLERSDRGHTDLPRHMAGGIALQVVTAVSKTPAGQNYRRNEASSDTLRWLAMIQRWPRATWSSPFERALHQANILADLDRRAGDALRLIRTRADLRDLITRRAHGSRAVGVVLGIEGAHALEGDLAKLALLDEMGLRVVGLTHFFDNAVGGSLHGVSGAGLSEFGRALVREAERRWMVVDVAHASPALVRDVLAVSERPVILSHGGFKSLCDKGRNLDDALMREIAAHGGLVGVGFWDGAVCDPSPRGVVRAIRHGIDLLGPEHVALGSDYDGATEVYFDSSEIAVLTRTMLDEGFSREEIRAVMGENVVRFFLKQLPIGTAGGDLVAAAAGDAGEWATRSTTGPEQSETSRAGRAERVVE